MQVKPVSKISILYNFTFMLNGLRFTRDYLLHCLKSKSKYNIHSPFVYHLLDEVIYDRKVLPAYPYVERIRKELLNDESVITITDLGAGSHINNKRQKKISEIARTALKPPKLAQLLYRLAERFKPKNIIELGTCLGTTTLYLNRAAPDAEIYTLEGCPQIARTAKAVFEKAGANTIQLITGNFDDTLPMVIKYLNKLDFVFIDGNHQREATLTYFEWCLPLVHDDTVLIFDDIYWSEGMKQAWRQIKAHPKVAVTIDLFWIGLVFFKSGQAKEDFLLKI
jgi:predicted O-methyltransferase YrrM